MKPIDRYDNIKMGMDETFMKSVIAGEKAFKQGDKMFKSMFEALPGFGPFTELLSSFGDIFGILEPFKAVFDVIGGLFKVLGAQIMPVLMDVLRPFLDILLKLMPVFELIGTLVATVLQDALIPLQIFFEILAVVLEPLKPLLEPITSVLKAIQEPIKLFVEFLVNVFLAGIIIFVNAIIVAINGIIWVINFLGNLFTLGLFADLPYIQLLSVPSFQEGTDYVPRTGLANLHQGEMVINAGQRNELVEGIAQLVVIQTRAYMDKENRKKFERSQRI